MMNFSYVELSVRNQISSKKFLSILGGCFLLTLSLILSIGFKNIFIDRNVGEQFLYKYQLGKLNQKSDSELNEVETIFVGDSSLGYAIDAQYFSTLSGSKSLSLALSGQYGYAGSYNMAKLFKEYDGIKNIVIMHTIDLHKRNVSHEGYFFTMQSFSDFSELDLKDKIMMLKIFKNNSFSSVREDINNFLDFSTSENSIENNFSNTVIRDDYVLQRTQLDTNIEPAILSDHLVNEKSKFLIKLVEYARERDLNLVYAHGPVWYSVVDNSKEYIESLNESLLSAGISPNVEILVMPDQDVGDTYDHVKPSSKLTYTELYYDLLSPHLRY